MWPSRRVAPKDDLERVLPGVHKARRWRRWRRRFRGLAEGLRPSWPSWRRMRRRLRHALLVLAEGMRPSWPEWLTRRRLRRARLILAEGMRPSWPEWLTRRRLRYALLVLAEGMRPAWASWLRRRRLRRRFILALLVVAALATATYFAAPPVGEAIKGWQSRRLAHQAFALIDQQKWIQASAKLRDAFLLDPHEPETWRAIARLGSRAGSSTGTLEEWKKVDKKHRLTIEDRRDFAGVALMAGELAVAATQIDQLLAQKRGPATVDILLAGQLAVRRQDPVLAVNYAERVMSDNRAKPHEILSAATLVLSVTTRASPPYIAAWKRIEDLARDPANAASLDALAFLAKQQSLSPAGPTGNDTSFSFELGVAAPQQSIPSSPLTGNTSLSLGPGVATPRTATTMGLVEIADALEHHPKGRPYHELLALQLRVRHDPARVEQYVADATERFGSGDDETLATLAAWLNSIGRGQKTLEVLSLDRATERQDLYLRYIDALFALERWDEVIAVLAKQRFPIDPVLQHTYLAIARSHLGEATAVTNEWQRALQAAAGDSDKLLALAAYAEQNQANDIADRAYV